MKMKGSKRLALVIVLGIALLVFVFPCFLGGPARKLIEKSLAGIPGTEAKIEGLQVRFPLRFRLDGFSLKRTEGGEYQASLEAERIQGRIAILPLLRGKVVLPRVRIEKPFLQVARTPEGKWILPFESQGEAEGGAEGGSEGARVDSIYLQEGKILLCDYQKSEEGARTLITGLEGTVRIASGMEKIGWELVAELKEPRGPRVEVEGEVLIQEESISISGFKASLADGTLTGTLLVDLAGKELSYEAKLENLDLGTLAGELSPEPKEIAGKLSATLKGKERWEEKVREASGTITIKEGNLWQIPVLHQLSEFLETLHLPGSEEGSFREAQGTFSLTEQGFETDDLRCKAGVLGLHFDGKVTYGQELDAVVAVEFGKEILGKMPAIGKITSWLIQGTSRNLLGIKMKGSIMKPRFGLAPISRVMGIFEDFGKALGGKKKEPEKEG